MKRILPVLFLFLLVCSQLEAKPSHVNTLKNTMKTDETRELFSLPLEENEVHFKFLRYSGVIVRASKRTIIIDPANLLKDEDLKALKEEGLDLLLFTHSHGDHFNLNHSLKIFNETGAPVLAEPLVARKLKGKIPSNKLISATPGKSYTIGDITVHAIKGEHIGPINLYQIKIGDLSIFHGGDSAYVPIKDYPSDIAFLPTGDPSPTASPQDALKMAADIKPSVVVAIHGSAGQNKEFERIVKGKMHNTMVIIPESNTSKTVTISKKT